MDKPVFMSHVNYSFYKRSIKENSPKNSPNNLELQANNLRIYKLFLILFLFHLLNGFLENRKQAIFFF